MTKCTKCLNKFDNKYMYYKHVNKCFSDDKDTIIYALQQMNKIIWSHIDELNNYIKVFTKDNAPEKPEFDDWTDIEESGSELELESDEEEDILYTDEETEDL